MALCVLLSDLWREAGSVEGKKPEREDALSLLHSLAHTTSGTRPVCLPMKRFWH